jgi:hypothetical protein
VDVYVTVDTHEGPRYVRTMKKTEEQAEARLKEAGLPRVPLYALRHTG